MDKITITTWRRENPENFVLHKIDHEGTYFIGKDQDNFIVLHDKYVSRCHASIINRDQKFFLKDEGSINGIILFRDGQTINIHSGMRRLMHNDVFSIGEHVFLVKAQGISFSESSLEKKIDIYGSSAQPLPELERNSLIYGILNFFQGNKQKEKIPTRRSLRLFINNIFVIESDFDAFVLDYYPEIKAKFSSGMNRTAQVNILLELAERQKLLERLRRENEGLYQAVSGLLEYE